VCVYLYIISMYTETVSGVVLAKRRKNIHDMYVGTRNAAINYATIAQGKIIIIKRDKRGQCNIDLQQADTSLNPAAICS